MNRVPNGEIIQRIEITSELLILRVKPDAGVPDFTPGQYVTLGLMGEDGKLLQRAYSIGSSPLEKQFLEFYLAIVPGGALTPQLAALREGDKLFLGPKIVGHFTLDSVPQGKNIIMISTGTGLAPFVSMVKTASIWEKVNSVTIIHGVRYNADFAYRDELLKLKKDNPRFSYYSVVSRQEPIIGAKQGRVQDLFDDGTVKAYTNTDCVFLCGNPAMIEDVEKLLMPQGFTLHSKKTPEGNLYYEKYW